MGKIRNVTSVSEPPPSSPHTALNRIRTERATYTVMSSCTPGLRTVQRNYNGGIRSVKRAVEWLARIGGKSASFE